MVVLIGVLVLLFVVAVLVVDHRAVRRRRSRLGISESSRSALWLWDDAGGGSSGSSESGGAFGGGDFGGGGGDGGGG